jgi:hypothetical protein
MSSPVFAAAAARRLLKRLARPAGSFDARRYFRGTIDLRFHNVGAAAMRKLARSIHAQHASGWTVNDAAAFADDLIVDRYLEVKGIGIELLARYRREFSPRLLSMWKGWLASGHAANWATTDAICGSLIGPLLVAHGTVASHMRLWSRHRSLWVRRASAVSLIPSVRRGALGLAYDVAAASSDGESAPAVGRSQTRSRVCPARSPPAEPPFPGRPFATRSNGTRQRGGSPCSRHVGHDSREGAVARHGY